VDGIVDILRSYIKFHSLHACNASTMDALMSASYCVGIPLHEWRIQAKDLENPNDSGGSCGSEAIKRKLCLDIPPTLPRGLRVLLDRGAEFTRLCGIRN